MYSFDFRYNALELLLCAIFLGLLAIPATQQRLICQDNRTPLQITAVLNQILIIITYVLVFILQQPLFSFVAFDFYFEQTSFIYILQVCFSTMLYTMVYSMSGINKLKIHRPYEELVFLFAIIMASWFILKVNDLFVLYLLLELQAFALILLISTRQRSVLHIEGSLRYFILSGLISACLLLGISLVYRITGTCNLDDLKILYLTNGFINRTDYYGIFLILAALFFKLGLAPFHIWIPIVYRTLSKEYLAIFAYIPKFALFFSLVRILVTKLPIIFEQIHILSLILVGSSIIIGLLGALRAYNLTSLLAYSSITSMGLILTGATLIPTNKILWLSAINFFFYVITGLGLYLMLNLSTIASTKLQVNYSYNTPGYNVITWSIITIIFSNAGIPPLAGFFSKFYIINIYFSENLFILGTLIFSISIISAFYYLVIIKFLKFVKPTTVFFLQYISEPTIVILIFFALLNVVFIIFKNDFLILINTFLLHIN